jgi:hypothetical protein
MSISVFFRKEYFVFSQDPRDICVQLNMCDQKVLEMNVIIPSDNVINVNCLISFFSK